MDPVEAVYSLVPPPLSSLPAKYHAPISLGLHSLSSGLVSQGLVRLAELDGYSDLALLLGLTHDVHQKLVHDGLATLRAAKRYLRDRLDALGLAEYWRYVDDALERDACGKGAPVPGLPRELGVACHIGDMAQGRLEGLSLLYWLREKVKEVSQDLTVRFYSVMIPQPFARAYAMLRIYRNHIASTDHIALASPWGLYVITYEDELPEVIEASWDELRIDPIIDYKEIVELEGNRSSAKINGVVVSRDEARNRLWSRFARMFYKREALSDQPQYPSLPVEVEGLFINIRFTDLDFKPISPGESNICGLCGMPHRKSDSLPITMYGTKQSGKISGIRVTPEKWNRFLPAHLKVKTWDSRGPWKRGIGMCPLCTLDAVAVRQLFHGSRRAIDGFLSLSLAKPVPVWLLNVLGQALRERSSITTGLPAAGPGEGEGLVLDYATATAATINVPKPTTENMFGYRELSHIGKLLSLGLYPLKFLPGLDTSAPDRLLTTTVTFQALDFPVTGKSRSALVPWVVKLVEVAGGLERSRGMEPLMDRPEHAPLHLLSLRKDAYDHVSTLLREVGVRA